MQLKGLAMIIALISGVMIGILLGALPGFGASQSLALLFPLTFTMPADVAILFFLAVYSAAEYGGSIPAILIRTPGTPAQAVTVIDGHAMSANGYPKRALRTSLFSGVFGGVLSTLIFLVVGTTLARIALNFGPGEMFALGIFGLSIIGSFFGKDVARGFLATGIGLLLATIGSSGFGGMRFTFGQDYLMEGIPIVVVIIAFLAGPEALRLLVDHKNTVEDITSTSDAKEKRANDRFSLTDARNLLPTWVRSGLLGTFIGAIPGAGAAVASLIAYSQERRWCKNGDNFGKGAIEGIAAPETANNAVVAGTLVPTLTLGIPGSGAAAILLSVLISKGVAPGPLLFSNQPVLIATIFFGMIFINFWLLITGLIFTRGFAFVAYLPQRILGPFVILMVMIGTYSYANYAAHVVMVLVMAFVAYWFAKVEIPAVPVVLAFVMGPIIEENMARAMTIHSGNMIEVLTRPIALIILALALATFIYSVRSNIRDSTTPQIYDG